MKTLVIGGSGFVGSRLISEFDNLDDIINFDKNNSPFFQKITVIGDIRNKEQLDNVFSNNAIESVVLLAAEYRDDVSPVSLYHDVNVKGTENVLDVMEKYEVKNLFFTSSVSVYGLNKDNPDESHEVDPFHYYGVSKWDGEKAIRKWYNKNPVGKSVTILRPTVIFGERNRGNVYNLLRQIVSGRFVMIGKGTNKKSMSYVGNISAFIKYASNNFHTSYKVFNYADKPDYSMNDLVYQIEKSLGKKIPSTKLPYWLGYSIGKVFDLLSHMFNKKFRISSVRVKKFCARTQFNSNKVHNEFNAPYSLEEGLDKTLKFEFFDKKNDEVLFFTE